jgi:hypothetical protein
MERIRSKKKESAKRPSQSTRYSARYLILVYSKTSHRFDALEIQRLVSREEGQCTIVRQLQLDDTSNHLAFVDFAGKRFQTRNLGLFDIQGHHPKWSQVRSSPWDTLDSMIASGEVVWNGLSRNAFKISIAHNEPSRSVGKTSTQWNHLGSSNNEEDITALCKKYMATEESGSDTTELEQMNDSVDWFAVSRMIGDWRDGYRAGYSDGLARNKDEQRGSSLSRYVLFARNTLLHMEYLPFASKHIRTSR